MDQIQELQDKVNSLTDATDFYDPETASSSALSHVPSQPISIPSPRGMISRDSCQQSDTRNSLGTSGQVFEGLPARGEPSSALFGNSKNLASSSCRLKPIEKGKIAEQREVLRIELQNCTIPGPRFVRKFSTWNPLYHAGGTYPQNCMMECLRNQISELHFDKFPDTSGFQCWKTNLKTEVCSCSNSPSVAIMWIKEVEVAKSVDDHDVAVSCRACIPWFWDAWCEDSVCFEEDHHDSVLPKKKQCGRAKCQKYDRFLRGRQNAYMINEHFRSTGAREAALDLSDLFNVSLQGDDIQDFDTRWDQAPPSASEVPKENVLESVCKMGTRESVQLQIVLLMYDQEIDRDREMPCYQRRLGWNSCLTSPEKSGRDRNENSASSSPVWHRDDNPFPSTERSGRAMSQRSSTGKAVREVQNQLTKVKLNHHNLEISNTRYIEKVFANVRQKLNRPEDDKIVLDQKVNVLDYLCQQPWKQRYTLEKISMTTCSLAGRPTSRRSRRYSPSRRNWSWTRSTRPGTSLRLNGNLLPGRDLLCNMT